jgi:p-hydroxybenzoate 3-monooxygenase
VGAGPAGLFLAHLLAHSGIDSIVLDSRTREEIETTVRAGILEQSVVDVLAATGASPRVRSHGISHGGIELRFAGEGHRIDFRALVDREVWLFPQHEVLRDLVSVRLAAGQDIRFSTKVESVDDSRGRVRILGCDAADQACVVEADFVVGADGSRSIVRAAVAGSQTSGYFREYPFAWFGILCDAPPSAPELVYSNSAAGFALVSQRSPSVQRMYLQCEPGLDPASLSDAEIWEQLQSRVSPLTLKEGPILQRDVLRFRSFVASKLLRRRIALVGDAAHTVPPTGAKGMNLAIADVVVLGEALERLFRRDDATLVNAYESAVLPRIWKAQQFSWWMTSMLHTHAETSDFDRLRQIGELRSVTESEAGSRFLAEAYTGWPLPRAERAGLAL